MIAAGRPSWTRRARAAENEIRRDHVCGEQGRFLQAPLQCRRNDAEATPYEDICRDEGSNGTWCSFGVLAGEPIEDSDDLFGSTVQLASRICDTADPDGVVVSDVVRQASGAVQSFTDLGHRDFKGFGEPIQVFDFDWR